MASMHCNYYSSSLRQVVDINLIVPTPEGQEQIISSNDIQEIYPYEKGLPVVYLLHGAYGNYASWIRFSNIERYAQQHRCIIVMASAENSFYQDMVHGNAYYTFFTKELPAFIRNIFPISTKREHTYIAGFSMGGYGAWFLALSNPDLYCKSASLSGALDLSQVHSETKTGEITVQIRWEDIFSNPENLAGSDYDVIELYKRCQAAGKVPALYQACGTEDFLYNINQSIKKDLEALGANLVYEEGPGAHDWDFWDKYIQNVLNWMFEK